MALDVRRELELLLRARTRLLAVETPEEDRVLTVVRQAAHALGLPCHVWTLSQGLVVDGGGPLYNSTAPADLLKTLRTLDQPSVFVLCDMVPYLDQATIVRALKDALAYRPRQQRAIVLLGADISLPPDLAQRAALVQWQHPSFEELEALVGRTVGDLARGLDIRVDLTPEQLKRLVRNLEGLTWSEAERALGRAIADDMALTEEDIAGVLDAKREILHESGAVELLDPHCGTSEVGGMASLRDWLDKRKDALSPEAEAFGIEAPRGLLLLGVQGCGKSLAAKRVAAAWQLPLLRLDTGRMYDKYIGESDKRLDRALGAAEHMAPCVLWIDEIEKAFAGASDGSSDGGLGRRLFGRLLTWLQERKAHVFVVATANDVSRLPPELLRKGRFDEVFFVDLPTAEERTEILRLHLARRERDPSTFELERLVSASEGFSGAELEQAIVSALYAAFAARTLLTTDHIETELRATRPLSVLRAEDVRALRDWAATRTVPAGKPG